jgi:hypothetical protein
MQPKKTIYVAVLDEGVACYRLVEAIHKRDDIYTITSPNPDPENERWEYTRGEDVRCKVHTFQSGDTQLTAYAKAS